MPATAAATGQPRRLLWIEGPPESCRALARALLQPLAAESIAWIGDTTVADRWFTRAPGRARQLLGRTLQAGVIDAHSGFDPDDLGALTGTLIGGGHCLLLSPPASVWPGIADAGMTAILSHGLALGDCRGLFIERFCRLLSRSSAVTRLDATRHCADEPGLCPLTTAAADSGFTANQGQRRVIAAVRRLAAQPEPGRLLITADRGRGKSAALGMAAAAIAPTPVRLCAVSRQAASTVFAHAGAAKPVFLAPERVTPEPGLLMIDEAAALPLGLLSRLVDENPRCILTSTVHGYEGSGRGLVLRLARRLAEEPAALQQLSLTEPIRWAADDPLEALVNAALLLDAEPVDLGDAKTLSANAIEPVSAAALAADEPRLRETFGLLVTGHYQTRPRDLRALLDDPGLQCWCSRSAAGSTTGIVLGRKEGGMDAELCAAILAGQRRPKGHLIAQSLTFHAGIPQAACLQGLRIQRIAVHPHCQRRGLGSALVGTACAAAERAGLDWIGASFGAHRELLEFWRENGFLPVRFGHRRDPRSGERSVIVLKGLSEAGRALLESARSRLAAYPPNPSEQY